LKIIAHWQDSGVHTESVLTNVQTVLATWNVSLNEARIQEDRYQISLLGHFYYPSNILAAPVWLRH